MKPLAAAGSGVIGEPETLMTALAELGAAYDAARADPAFGEELRRHLREFAGRPTELYFAERLTQHCGGAKIYFKREDLLHTGAHKINNVIGQALLAVRMGKKRIIAETGAGQHGVATATVCALFGLSCTIYMGAVDMERQALNVFRMRLMGAEVRGVEAGQKTLKEAIHEAMRETERYRWAPILPLTLRMKTSKNIEASMLSLISLESLQSASKVFHYSVSKDDLSLWV